MVILVIMSKPGVCKVCFFLQVQINWSGKVYCCMGISLIINILTKYPLVGETMVSMKAESN